MTDNKVVLFKSLESLIKNNNNNNTFNIFVCIFISLFVFYTWSVQLFCYGINSMCVFFLWYICGIFPAHCNFDKKNSIPQPCLSLWFSKFFHTQLLEPFTHGEARTRAYKQKHTHTKKINLYFIKKNFTYHREYKY